MAAGSQGAGGGRRTGLIVGVVLIVLIAAAIGTLAPISPVSCTTQGTVLVVQTTTVASTVMYTTSVPIQQATTQTKQVYSLNSQTIPPGQYVYQAADLTTGMDVQVTWNAANTLDVYVFNTAQNAAYAQSRSNTQPNIASAPSSQMGSLSFHVSGSDKYYLVFYNPHNGFFGLGSQPVGLFTATGSATFQGTATTYVTQTTSSVTYVPQQVTSTQTTTGSYVRTVNLLAQAGGSACAH